LIDLIYQPRAQVRENLDLDAQIAAINALQSYEQDAGAAIDAVGEVTAAGDYTARLAALNTLKALWTKGLKKRPRSQLVTRALTDRYADIPAPQVQIAAAELLGLYGPAAADAAPALREVVRDPDPTLRRAAGEALLNVTRAK